MTAAAVAALGIFAYPAVAAVILVRAGKRVDVAFARDMNRVLRSDRHGRSETADTWPVPPGAVSVPAGGDARGPRPVHAALPPAPRHLVGAVVRQTAAPARPPRVAVHG